MAKPPNLIKRRQTWYMRVRVPSDLVKIYGRKEITKTLKTTDHKEAKKRLNLEKALLDAEFESKRKLQTAQANDTNMLSGLSDHDLMSLVSKWMKEVKASEEKGRIKSTSVWTEEDKRDHFVELQQEELAAREELLGISSNEAHDGLTTASQFLKAEGISFDRKSEDFQKLGHLFTKAIHDLARMRLDEWKGKLTKELRNDIFVNGHSGFRPPKELHLSAFFTEYFNNPSVIRSQSTLNNYRIIQRALEEVIGSNAPIHTITREVAKKIQKLVMELPARVVSRAPGKTLAEAASMREKKGWPRQATDTFNGHMEKFRALMAYAVEEGYLPSNPAERLTIKGKTKAKDKRDPFSLEQLQKIFSAPLYTGCVNDKNGYNKVGSQKPRNARFWLPVIGLWTGMRMNEICQLQMSDIQVEKGVTVIRVTEQLDEEDEADNDMIKVVKTSSSIRVVPIHPMLERIGFLDHVAKMNAEGHDRLFPEIGMDTRGYYTKGISQWFSRFLKNIGAKTKRTSFHSFRHTYRDAMRAAELPFEISLDLGGWQRSTPESGYGSGFKADHLHKHLCKISYPELDLSHLYTQKK